MVHWLQIGGMKNSLNDDKKQCENLKSYLIKYPESKAEVWRKYTGDMFARFVRLDCEQDYDDLDLDCNSMSDGSIRHLNSKPSKIELCNKTIHQYIDRIMQCQ